MSFVPRLLIAPDERLDELGARHFPIDAGALQVDASTTHAVVTYPDSVRLVELATGEEIWGFELLPGETAIGLQPGPGGKVWIDSGHRYVALTRGELTWEIEIPPALHPLKQFHPGTGKLTCLFDNVIHVHDLATGEEIETIDTTEDLSLTRQECFTAVLPVPGALVAQVGRELTIWRDGELDALVSRRSRPHAGHGNGVWAISPAGTRIAELEQEGVAVFETEHFEEVAAVDFAATAGRFLDENRLVLWTRHYVTVADLATGAVSTRSAPWAGHRSFAVVDEELAVSLSALGELCVWEVSAFPAAQLPADVKVQEDPAVVVAAALGGASDSESILLRGRPTSRLVSLDHATGETTEHPHPLSQNREKLVRVGGDLFAVLDADWVRPSALTLWNRRDDTSELREFDRVLTVGDGFVLVAQGTDVQRLSVPGLEVKHRWVPPADAVIDQGFPNNPRLVQLGGDDGVFDIDANRRLLAAPAVVNGALAVTRGWHPVTYQQVFTVWDLESETELGEIDAADVVEFMPCAPTRSVFLRNFDGKMSMWKPGCELTNLSLGPEDWVSATVLSEDGRWVVGWGSAVFLWRTDAAEEPPITIETDFRWIGSAFCQNDRVLVSDPHGLLALYELVDEPGH